MKTKPSTIKTTEENIRVTTLSNGLRAATDTMPHSQSVNLGFYIDAGSRYEQSHEHGLTHLLEHMVFKGTKTRDVRTINKAIDDVGGSLGAYTARDEVAYYAQVLPEHTAIALNLISDMMLEPKFAPDDLEKEKSVISQEIGEALDDPEDCVFELLQEKAWPDQPLGRSILGTIDGLKPITSEQLRTYLQRILKADSCVIVAAGAVDHDQFVKEAELCFSSLKAGRQEPYTKATYKGGEAIQPKEQQEQLHFCYALQGVGIHDPDYWAQGIFTTILGGGVSSRLYHELREERGLAYAVEASHSPYEDTGLISMYAACDPARAREASEVMLIQLLQCTESISEEEFNRALTMIRSGILMAHENSDSRSERLAGNLLAYNRIISLEETLERFAAVKIQDIKNFASKILSSPLSRAAVGGTPSSLNSFEQAKDLLGKG